MPAITVNDLNNAQLDVNTIASVATSTAATVTDRLGNTKNTLSGMNAAVLASAAAVQGSLGYLPPVAYAAGISLTLAAQTVGYSGQTYAPLLSALPFTTSGTFETAKFRLIQGVSGADLAAPGGAGLVGYSDPVAPAYLKTVSDILNFEPISVLRNIPKQEWSAILAGTSTYAAAAKINELIDQMVTAKRGRLVFPRGLVLVEQHIKVRDYIIYEGEGWGSIVRAHPTSVDNVFGGYGPDYDFDIQNPVIKNMCIDGNSSAVSYNTANAGGADDAYQNIIRMHRWKNSVISGNFIVNSVFNSVSCYHGCDGSKIVNNYILNTGKAVNPTVGYYSYNGVFLEWHGDNIEISDNIITKCRQVGVIAQVADTGGMSKVGIRRNRIFQTQAEGIIVKDQTQNATGILDDFCIDDNYIQQATLGGNTAAIRVERNTAGKVAFNTKICGNKIKDSNYIGILVNTGCLSTIVSNNSIYASGDRGLIDAGTDTELNGNISLGSVAANLDYAAGVRTRIIGGQYTPTGPNEGQRGVFTPVVLTGGAAVGRTYASQDGSWSVGDGQVKFQGKVVLSGKGSSIGNITINGLPFPSKATGPFGTPTMVVAKVTFTGTPFALVLNNSSGLMLFAQATGAASTVLTDQNLSDASEFYFSGSYPI